MKYILLLVSAMLLMPGLSRAQSTCATAECSVFGGAVFCGYGCRAIGGAVFCAKTAGATCSVIGGAVFCGENCRVIGGAVFCGDTGRAQPAKPGQPAS